MKKLILGLLFLCFGFYLKAQEPFMWQITDEHGLPSMEVYNTFQDSKGYIWIGTDNGICRYDGKTFKTYSNANQKAASFSYFLEDYANTIWCINFAGQIFYIHNDSLKLFEPFEKVHKTGFPKIAITQKGELWIASDNNGIHVYDIKTKKFNQLPQFKNDFFNNIYCSKNDDIFINGITDYLIDKDQRIKKFEGPLAYAMQYSSRTDEVYFLNNNRSPLSLYLLNKTNYKSTQIDATLLSKDLGRITDLVVFSKKENWLLTVDGVYLFEINQQKITNSFHFLKGITVSGVIKDTEGNYWISTLKNGIYIIPSLNVWMLNQNNSSLSNSRISRIEEDKQGNLYLAGGQSTLIQFNHHTKKIIQQIPLENLKKDIDVLKIDKNNNTLYAHTGQLHVIDLKSFKPNKVYFPYSALKHIDVDQWGNKLISGSYYAYFATNAPNASPFYKQFELSLNKESGLQIHVFRNQRGYHNLFNMTDTSIWISFVDGLYVYKNGRSNKLTYHDKPIYATGLKLSKNGIVWIPTIQQGLLGYKDGRFIIHINSKNGLISDLIRCVETSKNYVWIATDKGVQGYNFITGKLKSFTREDGLSSTDVSDIHIKNGTVYLATPKGLQWFNENEDFTNKVAPRVYINEILVNDIRVPLSNQYDLPYNQNNLSVKLDGIGFKGRGNIEYLYRLSGSENDGWSKAKGNNYTARFLGLAPGNYRFELVARNEDGIVSENKLSIDIYIAPPYWQSWWFISLILFAITSMITLLFITRIRYIEGKNKLAKDKAELEAELRLSQLSALKVQMNPHFIFNALNSIQEYIITNNKKLANTYLGKFSDLIRMYLDMSNKTNVTLEEEIKAMRLYLELETMRFEENFSFELYVSNQLSTEEIHIPAMIIQPFIENAIKHGLLHKRTNRKLQIEFHPGEINHTITCVITDNGIGRKQSTELNKLRRKNHQSFATEATQKRLTLLNTERHAEIGVHYDDLLNHDGSAAGTKVTITIPYH
ncbi:MAG: histidine kinase [Bacteroidota bacterium]